jgi:hypothetical protein
MSRLSRVSSCLVRLLCCGWISVFSATSLHAQTLSFEEVGSIRGAADLVELQNEHAYVAAGHTFTIYDLSNPSAPVRRGAYTFPEQIWGFELTESRAYVGANFFGLGILDISNPASPTLLGSFKSPGQAKIVARFETTAALIDHMEGVVFVDLSKETTPSEIGTFFLEGYGRDIATLGSMAYAVDSPTGLYVFDLSGTGPWEPVGVLQAPSPPQRSTEVFDLSGGQGRRILCGVGGGGLQVYDVTDPVAPVKVAAFDTPGRAERVAINGDLAYVADGQAGLQVIDLSTPSAPRVVGGFATTRPAHDVAARDSLVLVVVGDGESEGEDTEVLILRQQP